MKQINFILYLVRIFFEMIYLFVAAMLFTLPLYVTISVISYILYKQKTRQQQHEK